MRRLELQEGIMLETEEGKPVGQSKIAAREGITMVVLSRVGMAAPGNTRIVLIFSKVLQYVSARYGPYTDGYEQTRLERILQEIPPS